jgi:hypothetical protein
MWFSPKPSHLLLVRQKWQDNEQPVQHQVKQFARQGKVKGRRGITPLTGTRISFRKDRGDMTMNTSIKPHIFLYRQLALLALLVLGACTPIERIPPRTLNVSGGPERVFDRPVAEILPQLEGATATGVNGRVGNELVFWGYQLRDSSSANLFACAQLANVNCEARISAICPGGSQEVTRTEVQGVVSYRDCRAVGIANVGDLSPNCNDRERNDSLLVGLAQCR